MGIFDRFKKNSEKSDIATSNNAQLSMNLNSDLVTVADQMLMATKVDLSTLDAVRLPIAEIAPPWNGRRFFVASFANNHPNGAE